MVLQSGKTVPVWGTDKPGQKVVVTIGDQTADCIADQGGRWRAEIAAAQPGGPFTMTVAGSSTLTFEDVMFGEVWLCSGQSNMHIGVNPMIKAGTFPKEHFDLPRVRLYTAGDKAKGDSTWRVCSPEAAQIGGREGVSQVGFYFARTIHSALDVPVGLIVAAQGYTDIETWTEGDAVKKLQQEKNFKAIYDNDLELKVKAIREWVADPTSTLPNVDKEAVRKVLEQYDNREQYGLTRLLALPVGPRVRDLRPGGGCFKQYVVPMIPYQIRGVAWYQGFNNRFDDEIYYDKLKALIESWRTAWSQPDLPFFFVQQQNSLGDGFIQKETQAAIMRTIPGTGMAVIQDLGASIHPDNKNEVGRRLALWPLAKTYGKDLECSGPLYKSMTVTGDTARIEFDHVGGGLISRDGKPLRWFMIAGADRTFVQAEATIDGNAVLVRSDKVSKPEAVRYAWDLAAVDLNLFNKAGLPASCFRTDNWQSR
jgi:sialate O-acetylesterase